MRTSIFDTEQEVDMTSLLDLMTVLAAVMMICVPPVSVLSTNLAKVNEDRNNLSPEFCITVGFSKEGQLMWNNDLITWDELRRNLATYDSDEDRPQILLAGDAEANYGFSVRLRALFSKHGFETKELAKCGGSE